MLTPRCCDNHDEFSVAILQWHVTYQVSVSAGILSIRKLNIVVSENNAVSSSESRVSNRCFHFVLSFHIDVPPDGERLTLNAVPIAIST